MILTHTENKVFLFELEYILASSTWNIYIYDILSISKSKPIYLANGASNLWRKKEASSPPWALELWGPIASFLGAGVHGKSLKRWDD